ncbi:hypothetical protein DPMN_020463 [Dreissena polymorpha]|uniref:Uncharacterized protein n=1 Tax=Dreissena polymorpha TaxID=45954 RepID=A0A9D4NKG2_DREPO|nr:hypothetical protein DPMN_020463 [Dreissena polymorpha]
MCKNIPFEEVAKRVDESPTEKGHLKMCKNIPFEEVAKRVDESPTEKGHLKMCKNYCKHSLISHPSKFMLRNILCRLTSKADELLDSELCGSQLNKSSIAE